MHNAYLQHLAAYFMLSADAQPALADIHHPIAEASPSGLYPAILYLSSAYYDDKAADLYESSAITYLALAI